MTPENRERWIYVGLCALIIILMWAIVIRAIV